MITVLTNCYLILGAEKPILIDSSFRDVDEILTSSGLVCHRKPEHDLALNLIKFGLKPEDIGCIIVHTHHHLDHTGLDYFLLNAKFIVQRKELQYRGAPLFPVPFYDRVDLSKVIGPLWSRVDHSMVIVKSCRMFVLL